MQFEERKRGLSGTIEAESVCAALCEDEHSFAVYFDKFMYADFDNPEVCNQTFEYSVDKICTSETGVVIALWYSKVGREIPREEFFRECGSPFDKGEVVKLDCFPFGSTITHKPAASVFRGSRLFLLAPCKACVASSSNAGQFG